jgi:hypothetical protein
VAILFPPAQISCEGVDNRNYPVKHRVDLEIENIFKNKGKNNKFSKLPTDLKSVGQLEHKKFPANRFQKSVGQSKKHTNTPSQPI